MSFGMATFNRQSFKYIDKNREQKEVSNIAVGSVNVATTFKKFVSFL